MHHRTKYVVGGEGNSVTGCHSGWPHASVVGGRSSKDEAM
jgi:hypothetical protein